MESLSDQYMSVKKVFRYQTNNNKIKIFEYQLGVNLPKLCFRLFFVLKVYSSETVYSFHASMRAPEKELEEVGNKVAKKHILFS